MAEQDFKSRFPETAALLDSARGDVFPAYAAGVYAFEKRHFGFGGCGPKSLFDLASLTKVLCTTTLVALAEQKGVLSVDLPVKRFFPDFPSESVTLRHLLDHSSGLPAWLPLHALFHGENSKEPFDARITPPLARERYEREILASWKSEEFEKSEVYSDLGFLLLGWALEKATTMSLDALFQEWVALPLNLASLQFLPTWPDVVPTEDCPWRGHVLHGEVHDDNCYVLGGVAGHAGLFGRVEHVLELGRLWLQSAAESTALLAADTARKFLAANPRKGFHRGLGWDGVSPQGSSSGKYFSPSSRGHLGYTGTSLWIDLEKQLVVTLLTNRVHPTRKNEKIKAFRPLFHDSLLKELGATGEPKRDS